MDLLKGFHGEFAWFIWGLVLLGVIWFFTGGTESPTAHEGAYLEPPAPLDSGRAYGKYYEGGDEDNKDKLNLPTAPGNLIRKIDSLITSSEQAPREEVKVPPLLTKKVMFKDLGKAKESLPEEEYLRLVTAENSKDFYKISGLFLRGSGFNVSFAIPEAANILTLGTTATKSAVILPPRGTAIITTGRSPVGASFRVNKCTGYLDQFQDYVPDLDKKCPAPMDEYRSYGPKNDPNCAAFIEEIPRCRIYQGAPPKTLSQSCIAFLAEKLNYNACVANHKNDKDFYTDEWRLFLNQTKEIWKNKDEIIRLMDSKGNVLDALTY